MSESEEESTSGADWPVTEEWLQAVLKEHHQDLPGPSTITVLDFTVKPGCETGESVLSDILAVAVKYCLRNDQGGASHSLSFIVKLLPQDPFSRYFVTEAQFDLREIRFYTQVVPDLEAFKQRVAETADVIRLPIPKCYHAHYSAGTNDPEPSPPESVLVLENIKPQGYNSADFSRGLNLRQTTAAVEAIAQLHSLSLSMKVREDHQSVRFLPTTGGEGPTAALSVSGEEIWTGERPRSTKRPETPHERHHREVAGTGRTNGVDYAHGLLVQQSDVQEDETSCECAILDWQMVTYSRPTNDLALLLISSVPAELRRLHTDSLLDGYWECITSDCRKLGVDIEGQLGYDRKKLSEDYKRSQLLALLLCIGSVDLAIGNAEMEERLVVLLQDLYSDGLLNADVAGTTEN
ncbi:hypothetical protein NQ317_018788 [Molorchus minor]|uniref:CHK kinase-like domain-containing protein n=1 Tax=Molorchus minor TaxID=1323400 RepID=A0ABQ9J4Q2_9CUCU|nr:hypothetical protein NQ317_018788 [Molorchus minor]